MCLTCRGLVRLLRTLLVKNLAERKAEITNLPGTQTEKDNALARCRVGQRAWACQKNQCFVSVLSLMKTVIPWKTKMNQEEGFVSIGSPFHKPASRARGHHQYERILRYVQKVPDDIRWTVDRTEFDEVIDMNSSPV